MGTFWLQCAHAHSLLVEDFLFLLAVIWTDFTAIRFMPHCLDKIIKVSLSLPSTGHSKSIGIGTNVYMIG